MEKHSCLSPDVVDTSLYAADYLQFQWYFKTLFLFYCAIIALAIIDRKTVNWA